MAITSRLIREQAVLDAAERKFAKDILSRLIAGEFTCVNDGLVPTKCIKVDVKMCNTFGPLHPDFKFLGHHGLLKDLLSAYGIHRLHILFMSSEVAKLTLEVDSQAFVMSMQKIRDSFEAPPSIASTKYNHPTSVGSVLC